MQAFPPDISALAHACINPRSVSHHCKQRTTQRVIFSIESDDQPDFLVSLPDLLQKAFESLVTAPLTFFLRVISKSSMPPSGAIALTSDK